MTRLLGLRQIMHVIMVSGSIVAAFVSPSSKIARLDLTFSLGRTKPQIARCLSSIDPQHDSSVVCARQNMKLFASRNHNGTSERFNASSTGRDASNKSKSYKPRKKFYKKRRRGRHMTAADIEKRFRRAERTEDLLVKSINALYLHNSATLTKETPKTDADLSLISFPTARECNGAIAAFGDAGDFERALRIFRQMRKTVILVSRYNSAEGSSSDGQNTSSSSSSSSRIYLCPPSPTLVTYSTLMSRAVGLGKERVALRLWRLMILQSNFFANSSTPAGGASDAAAAAITMGNGNEFGSPIVPDIRAVNILMNAFAKIGMNTHAQMLMEQLYSGTVVPYDTSVDEKDFERGLIHVVPRMEPNIVTYNTLIDACHRAGDLDAALEALKDMKENTNLKPDAMTYTSLIATVARKDTRASGKRDPDLAFSLFDEMVAAGIKPNGMTFCALIDVCGRCRRSDMALKGLRMMLREKAQRKEIAQARHNQHHKGKTGEVILFNEVGAWTAAIDACGKAGRIKSAISLFEKMSELKVKPNTVTCGALTDCLLKENYLAETVKVLRYMKKEGMEPSEVMYTSLITSASKLAKTENEEKGEIVLRDFGHQPSTRPVDDDMDEDDVDGEDAGMRALDVYKELILSLISHPSTEETNDTDQLFKVFLVLQEMKGVGADPDIACYNAILKACGTAGSMSRVRNVLDRIEADGLVPNSKSWREILRAAAIARDSSIAEEMWEKALTYNKKSKTNESWLPKTEHLEQLFSSYSREASKHELPEVKAALYTKVVEAYTGIENGEENLGLCHIDLDKVRNSHRAVKMIIQAANYLDEYMSDDDDESEDSQQFHADIRRIAKDLTSLNFF